LAIAFFPVAVILRRGKSFLADWIPLVIVLLAYETFRGIATHWYGEVHASDVMAVEQWLFGHRIPTVRLQEMFHTEGKVGLMDIIATGLYMLHFVGALGLAFWLWFRSRALYWRFV